MLLPHVQVQPHITRAAGLRRIDYGVRGEHGGLGAWPDADRDARRATDVLLRYSQIPTTF
jgi:hypothetical protein